MIGIATERRRCQITGKQVHPGEGLGMAAHQAVFYSLEGLQRHLAALALLATGKPPAACQECNRPVEQCRNERGQPALYVHLKDGLYQCLCLACSDRYVEHMKDRFQQTPYGAAQKL